MCVRGDVDLVNKWGCVDAGPFISDVVLDITFVVGLGLVVTLALLVVLAFTFVNIPTALIRAIRVCAGGVFASILVGLIVMLWQLIDLGGPSR